MAEHQIEVRVYYEDTDFSGVVYHANYLKYFERGRTEMLRASGVSHAEFLDAEEPLAFTARRIEVEFIKPARIDDLLVVHTGVESVKGARMIFRQRIEKDGEVLATASVEVVSITLDGRPRRMPDAIRQSGFVGG